MLPSNKTPLKIVIRTASLLLLYNQQDPLPSPLSPTCQTSHVLSKMAPKTMGAGNEPKILAMTFARPSAKDRWLSGTHLVVKLQRNRIIVLMEHSSHQKGRPGCQSVKFNFNFKVLSSGVSTPALCNRCNFLSVGTRQDRWKVSLKDRAKVCRE